MSLLLKKTEYVSGVPKTIVHFSALVLNLKSRMALLLYFHNFIPSLIPGRNSVRIIFGFDYFNISRARQKLKITFQLSANTFLTFIRVHLQVTSKLTLCVSEQVGPSW